MLHVKPIDALTAVEIRDLARAAAERGERIEDVNPFTAGHAHDTFDQAFREREGDLQPAG